MAAGAGDAAACCQCCCCMSCRSCCTCCSGLALTWLPPLLCRCIALARCAVRWLVDSEGAALLQLPLHPTASFSFGRSSSASGETQQTTTASQRASERAQEEVKADRARGWEESDGEFHRHRHRRRRGRRKQERTKDRTGSEGQRQLQIRSSIRVETIEHAYLYYHEREDDSLRTCTYVAEASLLRMRRYRSHVLEQTWEYCTNN